MGGKCQYGEAFKINPVSTFGQRREFLSPNIWLLRRIVGLEPLKYLLLLLEQNYAALL